MVDAESIKKTITQAAKEAAKPTALAITEVNGESRIPTTDAEEVNVGKKQDKMKMDHP